MSASPVPTPTASADEQVGWTAIVWVMIITVLFVLSTVSPIKWSNFNYTIVAVGLVVLGAWLAWVLSARHWFTGPRHTIDEPPTPAEHAAAEAG
jgi:protein-S-isoprenylcysteine O-methyltransferase Ste14